MGTVIHDRKMANLSLSQLILVECLVERSKVHNIILKFVGLSIYARLSIFKS